MSDDLPIRRKPPEGAAGEAEEGRLTPRERLRARRERLARGSTQLFVLPGYDEGNDELGGQLVARYRRMLVEELTNHLVTVRERWVNDDGRPDSVAANAQFLVDSCVELLIREPDGTFTPLVEGHKTTYTVDLASGESLGTILGIEHLPTIRAQLVEAFGGNEIALNDHSEEVYRWMVSANALDAETALGEA